VRRKDHQRIGGGDRGVEQAPQQLTLGCGHRRTSLCRPPRF
jgi:hypothetical protein